MPKSAFPEFAGRDELMHAMSGQAIKALGSPDRTPPAYFNKVAASPVGIYGGMKPVNVNLEEYVTQKALDALFLKVGEEEKKIRENPVARITAILKRVFGQLDKK